LASKSRQYGKDSIGYRPDEEHDAKSAPASIRRRHSKQNQIQEHKQQQNAVGKPLAQLRISPASFRRCVVECRCHARHHANLSARKQVNTNFLGPSVTGDHDFAALDEVVFAAGSTVEKNRKWPR
jgi:hypothetical protein